MKGSESAKMKKILRIFLLAILVAFAIWNAIWFYYRYVIIPKYYDDSFYRSPDVNSYCLDNEEEGLYSSVDLPSYLSFKGLVGMCGVIEMEDDGEIASDKYVLYRGKIGFGGIKNQNFVLGVYNKNADEKGIPDEEFANFYIDGNMDVLEINSREVDDTRAMEIFEYCRPEAERFYATVKKLWGDFV